MSSIAKTITRSKKTRRLGAVRVIRPEQYEAFDVNSKVCSGSMKKDTGLSPLGFP